MTVSNQTPSTSATANGVTTVFPFGFYVAQASDLVVRFGGIAKVLNVDYTVTGTGNDVGGTITATTAPANGVTVEILRSTPLVRDEDFQNAGDLPADEVNRQFDRLWQALQDIDYAVDSGSGGGGGGGGGTGDVLAVDLLDTTNPVKGGGSIGYGATTKYPAGTIGAELRTAQSQAEHMWRAIRNNQRDVYIIVTGDSTGNELTEWVYLMTQWLASECPTHTVKYRTFNDGTTSWDAYSTVQTGSGPALPFTVTPFTIWIDNGSVSGTNTFYTMGARESAFWTGNDYDLAIINYGHNLGTGQTEYIALPEWVMSLAHVRSMAPRAGLLVTLQNPRSSTSSDINTNGSAASARMVAAWRKAVELVGAGVIDVYTAFKTHPDYASLMADETHPNSAGQAVWLNEVKRVLAEPVRLTGDSPLGYNPLVEMRPNFAPNPRFSKWTASTPEGWAFTNCVPVKQVGVTDGTLYSMEVQIGAGTGPSIIADVTTLLAKFRGKTVSFMARLWIPSGLNLLAGRIAIETTDNTTNPNFTSYPRGTPSNGGWQWVFASLALPRLPKATAMQLRIYAGAADGSDSGKKFWVDSVWFGEGLLPAGVGFDDVSLKTVTDYYSDSNVGKFTGNTGTLTVASGSITVVGAPSALSDTYINLPGLTPGKTYKVSFNAVSGTGGVQAGGVYMRNGYDGGSTDLAKASGTGDWTNAGGAVSFTFVAPNGPVSVRPYGYTNVTGYVLNSWSIKPVESGIAKPINIPINTAKNTDGTTLTVAAPAGGFGITNIVGTSTFLIGESAQGNTKTDAVTWEVALPADYVATRDLTLTVNAYASGTGTIGATKTLALAAYLISDTAGTHGSNLGGAVTGTLTNAAADTAFTIAGTTLSPSSRLLLRLTASLNESGGVNPINARINSVRLS